VLDVAKLSQHGANRRNFSDALRRVVASCVNVLCNGTVAFDAAHAVLAAVLSMPQSMSLTSRDVGMILQAQSSLMNALIESHNNNNNNGTSSGMVSARSQRLFVCVFDILFACNKYRMDLVMKHVSTMLEALRALLGLVLRCVDADASSIPVEWSERVSRLLEELGQRAHKKSLNKYVPYLIVDVIRGQQRYTLSPHHQRALLPGVYALLSICSKHEFQYIFSVLPAACKPLFKTLHSNYSTKFKFQG
jgi:hypothetical protein